MIVNDLDLGLSHPWPAPQVGTSVVPSLIVGSRSTLTATGQLVERQVVDFLVQAWQGIGGQSAMSFNAIRYFIRQLEELGSNPDLQPAYIQWTASQAAGAYNVADPHDGWYIVEDVQPDYQKNLLTGQAMTRLTVGMVAPATPSSLSLWYSGAGLSTTYSAVSTPLLAFPVGSTAQPPTTGSRTGGEGAIPISLSPVPNPVPFIRPGVVANWFTGGCRVWDTINTGSNPVPVAGGTYVHANWVEVKGQLHDFVGDCVVTNGLQLLLYQVGQAGVPLVYLWNTSLGTPTWQSIGTIQYRDNAGNAGTLQEINLDRIGLQEVRVRSTVSTSSGNYVRLKQKIQAGCYHTFCELSALTENATNQLALAWSSTAAYATGFTDSASSTTFPSNLATTTVSGYAAAQGSASGSPIFGLLFQNIPTTAQGRLSTTSLFGYGDSVGPTSGAFKLYGFFVVPYSGAVVLATAQGVVAPIFQQFLFDKSTQWVRG
jgi:hypothetical protein